MKFSFATALLSATNAVKLDQLAGPFVGCHPPACYDDKPVSHDDGLLPGDGLHDDGSGYDDPLINGIGVVAEPFRLFTDMSGPEGIHGVLAGPTTLQVEDPANPDGFLGVAGEEFSLEVDSPVSPLPYHGFVESPHAIHIVDDSSPMGPGLTVTSVGGPATDGFLGIPGDSFALYVDGGNQECPIDALCQQAFDGAMFATYPGQDIREQRGNTKYRKTTKQECIDKCQRQDSCTGADYNVVDDCYIFTDDFKGTKPNLWKNKPNTALWKLAGMKRDDGIHGVLSGPTTLQVEDPANPDGFLGVVGSTFRLEVVDPTWPMPHVFNGLVLGDHTLHVDDPALVGPGFTVTSE